MEPPASRILTLNAGSASIKFALFESGESLQREVEGVLDRIGFPQASLTVTWCERRKQGREWMPREPSRFIAEMGEAVQKALAQGNTVPDAGTARAKASALRAMLAGKP